MGAFKQLNAQDIIISPLELNKGFEARTIPLTESNGGYGGIGYGLGIYGEGAKKVGNYPTELSIERYIGLNDPFLETNTTTGYFTEYNQSALYNSVKQLYYTNFLFGNRDDNGNHFMSTANAPEFLPDGTVTGSSYNTIYDNYRQTDLLENKEFPTESGAFLGVLSIPSGVYGDRIQPGSFKFNAPQYSGSGGGLLLDDGEGRLVSGSTVVGNIVYTHGIVTLTRYDRDGYHYQDYNSSSYGNNPFNENWFYSYMSGSEATASFSSSYTVYETQYKCTIGESEYNYTQNPSAISGSDGHPYDYITGSYFSPYVTTVGLYNDAYELLAVGKLAKPLPTSKLTDTTILVNLDRQ